MKIRSMKQYNTYETFDNFKPLLQVPGIGPKFCESFSIFVL